MCTYCYATLGAVVGAAVVAKVGGAAAAKAALVTLAMRIFLLRR